MATLAAWRTVQVAAPTVTGTQSITTDLDGHTPKAMVIEVTKGVTAGTQIAHAVIGVLLTDGTKSLGLSLRSRDNQSTSDTGGRRYDGGLSVVKATGNAVDGELTLTGFKSGGADINWSDALPTAALMNVTFFYGDALSAAVVYEAGSSVIDGVATISGLSFAPNMVFVWGCQLGYVDPSAGYNQWRFHTGAACDNEGVIEQACFCTYERDNFSLGTAPACVMRDDSVLQALSVDGTGTATFLQRAEITAFNSDGIDITTRDVAANTRGAYLLLDVGDNRRTVTVPDLKTTVTGTGTGKKVTPSSNGRSWEPACARVVGTDAAV